MKVGWSYIAIGLFLILNCSHNVYAQTNTFPSDGRVGIGTTNPEGLLHVAGELVTSAAGWGTVRKFSTSVSSTQAGPFKIGEFTHSGNFQNLLITGKVYGQHGKYFGEVNFSVVSRSYTLPAKSVKFHQTQVNGGKLLELKVYKDEDSGRVVIGFISSSELQSFGWDITIIERFNYGIWENENSYVKLDPAGLTEVSQGANRLTFMPGGNVGIGTTNPTAKLAVDGDVKAKEVIVTEQSSDWPDYVFTENYRLPELTELETYIQQKGHLPGIPTKKEVDEEGQNLGAIQAKLLQKIEELTLYIIKLEKRDRAHLTRIEALEEELNTLKGEGGYSKK